MASHVILWYNSVHLHNNNKKKKKNISFIQPKHLSRQQLDLEPKTNRIQIPRRKTGRQSTETMAKVGPKRDVAVGVPRYVIFPLI
jgi:hypothetical protein